MPEEPKITMTEFKTVIEGIHSEIKRVSEVMLHNFGQVDTKLQKLDRIEGRLEKVEINVLAIREQVALLHEGQTEIKNELSQKVGRDEFGKLEVRVAKLESKVA
jgi:hypothetical protein